MTLSSRKLASMNVGGAALLALSLSGAAFAKDEATSTEPSNHEPEIEAQSWTFSAPFGTYDNAQLQRGFQVYKDVCSNCHSMRLCLTAISASRAVRNSRRRRSRR